MVVVIRTLNHKDNELQADVLLAQVLRNAGHECEIVAGSSVMGASNKESVVLLHLQLDAPLESHSSASKSRSRRSFSIDSGDMSYSKGNEERLRNARELENALARKTREAQELDHNLKVALKSIKTFHRQQNELFEEFVALREKYDAHKLKLRQVLWDYIPNHIAGFESIPAMQTDLRETDEEVGDWLAGRVLGEGQFATVKAVRDGPALLLAKSGFLPEDLAVKRIIKDRVTDVRNMGRVNNEIRLLRDLDHPCIARLVDVCHTEKYLYLVQEKGGMDLFEHYRVRPGPAEEKFVQSVFKQLCSAVRYLFTHEVVHRDIKPENILIDARGHVKLVDFGLSTYHAKHMTLDDFCGTPGFFAPEMLVDPAYSSETLDVWSLGCVLLEMLLGHGRFAEVWMPAYAYEHLHDAQQFDRELLRCVGAVKAIFGQQLMTTRPRAGTGQSVEEKEGEEQEGEDVLGGHSHKRSYNAHDNVVSSVACSGLVGTNSAPNLLASKDEVLHHHPRMRRSSEVYPHAITHHINFKSCVYAMEEQATRSAECKDFLLALLVRNPASRLRTHELEDHPFITNHTIMPAVVSKSSESFSAGPVVAAAAAVGGGGKGSGGLGLAFTMPVSSSHNAKRSGPAALQSSALQVETEADLLLEDGLRDRLPPLSPASPKVEGMQELVKVGDDLLALHHLNMA
ncbi:Protein kinase, putative [Hondaea fermentalgiana]|uniref:Protein kinase, putative n=1 Tax=Hondaea fermentalgiana TaxID=2315210 RepID=A0A2R5GSK0_9STRA|nr:Protein kinase, putative [Hondaea fermentalgiana]|eukprot:GBG31623.1 Protein kinase, putative [Hondaea fermentalgiana]